MKVFVEGSDVVKAAEAGGLLARITDSFAGALFQAGEWRIESYYGMMTSSASVEYVRGLPAVESEIGPSTAFASDGY